MMKYRELLKALSELTDEQLDQTVFVMDEEDCRALSRVLILDEDHINPTGESMEPVSGYADDPDYADEEIVAHKDDVFLLVVDPATPEEAPDAK